MEINEHLFNIHDQQSRLVYLGARYRPTIDTTPCQHMHSTSISCGVGFGALLLIVGGGAWQWWWGHDMRWVAVILAEIGPWQELKPRVAPYLLRPLTLRLKRGWHLVSCIYLQFLDSISKLQTWFLQRSTECCNVSHKNETFRGKFPPF